MLCASWLSSLLSLCCAFFLSDLHFLEISRQLSVLLQGVLSSNSKQLFSVILVSFGLCLTPSHCLGTVCHSCESRKFNSFVVVIFVLHFKYFPVVNSEKARFYVSKLGLSHLGFNFVYVTNINLGMQLSS